MHHSFFGEGSYHRLWRAISRGLHLGGTASRILEVFHLSSFWDLFAGKERNREGRIDLERGEVFI
ncbi:unnamed protein product, partial [Vitis vinifera]|uniref:Uncharacterized protein n=1 Tax=Vitis vinifera TaxID=29760 RepID=D7TG55_VITVI